MRPRTAGVLLILTLAVGCSRPRPRDYLEVQRAQRDALHEMTKILANVTDKETMAEAGRQLGRRQAEFDAIPQRAAALPKPPPPEAIEMLRDELPLMQAATERLQDEVRRVGQLPGGPAFLKRFETNNPSLLPMPNR